MSQRQSQGLGGLSYKSTNDLSGLVADVTNGNPIGTTYKNAVGLAVIADTAHAASIVVAGANARILGVLRDNPRAGEAGAVGYVRGGSEKCLSGGVITVGALLSTDANGRMVVASAAAQVIVAIAQEAAAAAGLPFEAVLIDSYVA